MRSSILAARPAGSMQTEPFFFAQSEAVPARPTDADGTLSGVAPRAPPPRTEPTDPHIDVIRSSSPVRMVPTTAGTTAGMPTWASPPRLELPPHEPVFDWGHSYDTPALRVTHAIESFYSQPETLPSMYAQSRQAPDIDMSDVPIGQAVSAPGRVSPFKVGSFPLPPTSRPFASSSRTLLPPPNHVTSTSRPPLSSIFEYTDFADSRHVSTATTRSHETDPTRQIWNSYEKPLWDRQSSLGDNSIDGGVEREEGGTGRSRSKSLKSVRWGDEEEESGIFGLARAL